MSRAAVLALLALMPGCAAPERSGEAEARALGEMIQRVRADYIEINAAFDARVRRAMAEE